MFWGIGFEGWGGEDVRVLGLVVVDFDDGGGCEEEWWGGDVGEVVLDGGEEFEEVVDVGGGVFCWWGGGCGCCWSRWGWEVVGVFVFVEKIIYDGNYCVVFFFYVCVFI